jgi:hypothetical protein
MNIYLMVGQKEARDLAEFVKLIDPRVEIKGDMGNEATVVVFPDKSYLWMWRPKNWNGKTEFTGAFHIDLNSPEDLQASYEKMSSLAETEGVSIVSELEDLSPYLNYEYHCYKVSKHGITFEVCYEPPHTW